MLKRRKLLTSLASIAAFGAMAGTVQAVHWPFFGGDNGRSGYQPVGEGTAPVKLLYSQTAAGDQFIKTSILTTAGGQPDVQRLIYGTVNPQETDAADANGRVHLRVLGTGAPVGPPEGVKIDDRQADPDVFGPGAAAPEPASVSFVDTSSATALGQVFAVHNDDGGASTVPGSGDISIAQIDQRTGSLLKQQALEGTEGFSLSSSPVATGPDAAGGRSLFFVAENGDDERLFRVPIAAAATPAAAFGQVTSTDDIDADPQASPALVFLRDGNGTPAPHVAVGTQGSLRTYAASDLAAGPASADLGGSVQTPTVPIQPSGMTPSPTTPVTSAPFIYVASTAPNTTTRVHKLVQQANAQSLTTAVSSPALAGAAAPALATDQESEAAGVMPGKVIVTTGANLYLLDSENLQEQAAFSSSALAPGTTGFGQTTAAASGELIYVTDDEGGQRVLGIGDAQPVAAEAFTEDAGNGGARLESSGMGQPSISRSFIQFGSQKGLFVYANACGNDITGTDGTDSISGSPGGDNVVSLGGDDRVSGLGGDDCIDGGGGDDALSGNAGDDVVQGMSGDDTVFGRGGDDALSGNAGDDVIRGGLGDDRLFGRIGNDRLLGGPGDDRAIGGPGNDGISGDAGNDVLRGNAGNDRIFGRAGDDAISGNAGDDLLVGGPGNDRIFGRAGDDRIRARDGERDIVNCGAGRDVAIVDRLDVVRGCERVIRR